MMKSAVTKKGIMTIVIKNGTKFLGQYQGLFSLNFMILIL